MIYKEVPQLNKNSMKRVNTRRKPSLKFKFPTMFDTCFTQLLHCTITHIVYRTLRPGSDRTIIIINLTINKRIHKSGNDIEQ